MFSIRGENGKGKKGKQKGKKTERGEGKGRKVAISEGYIEREIEFDTISIPISAKSNGSYDFDLRCDGAFGSASG